MQPERFTNEYLDACDVQDGRTPIDEADNADLVARHETRAFTVDEVMGERERVAEVIDLHAMTGDDLTWWFDRARILETIRGVS